MGQTVSGTFIMDNGVAANIDIGFIPDHVKLISNLEEGDNEVIFEWWRALADLGDKGVYTEGRYGISISCAGAVTVPTTAATGIVPYDGKKTPQVLIPSYDGDGLMQTSVYGDYDTTADYSSVGQARSTSQLGTVVRPTTHNGYVYECTTAGGTDATEPTWPTTPGESVDAGNNVWICREENIVRAGGLGFTVGETMNIDSDQCIFTAEKHLRTGDMGDAARTDPITWL